ncbi:hypothetical protein FUSO4_11325 [Fusobacterium necrophorum DJ-1]|uniref:Uncharacterized protein n=2 Tax=Fusobacterium necrophorum TaxID=859 RepID=A0AB73BW04_9FUSO|nr:hypothetical protein FUSO4_11325 [Fusobacterium necrophorum DJ-1]KDE62958.1 hypothetical protein FUSO5_08780 [Fusobacterium necrophorum BFTR-1]KDE63000.1 hypothetical protein FUSO3_06405 [Fusobacterium necrophorum BL]KDE68582.1 hypothetical protein FUSO6_08390 [Fusobacterium necrophorum DAB]KDE69617.1 hypothetical protein FUSO8_11120 [Fusobacterium necrophorum DJ-2]KDE71993.1 hypothetical protein FUSO7_08920 [Fusobacterium necrophorum BFTR-2]
MKLENEMPFDKSVRHGNRNRMDDAITSILIKGREIFLLCI